MPYILYHVTDGPLAYVDGPAHKAVPGENEIVIPCETGADVNDAAQWAEALAAMQATGMPAPTLALTYDYLQGMFSELIQERLDAFARTKIEVMPGVTYTMYDDIRSAISYAGDPDPVFSLEGRYALTARSSTWNTANAALAAVMTGLRPVPAWEELEAELPPLAWPEGSRGHVAEQAG